MHNVKFSLATTEDPANQCNLAGCKNVRNHEKNGKVHDYCCKEHSKQADRMGISSQVGFALAD